MTSVLIALLAAFVTAVWWWGEQGRADASYGVAGATTVRTAQSDDLRAPRPGAMVKLRQYLDTHDIPLIVVCVGDTRPGVVVLGPVNRISWLSDPVPPGTVLLLSESYAAQRWSTRHTLPGFIPRGFRMAGVTPGPPAQHYLQFVVGGVARLPAADYILGTKNPTEVSALTDLLGAAGAPTSPPIEVPAVSMWGDPAVVGTVLMLMAALACLALDWALLAGRLMPRLQLALRHGASGRVLSRRAILSPAPVLAVGAAVGAATVLLIPLTEEAGARQVPFQVWPLVTLGAGALVLATWSVVVLVATRVAVHHAG